MLKQEKGEIKARVSNQPKTNLIKILDDFLLALLIEGGGRRQI